VKCFEGDSYLVKMEDGRLVRKRHSDLKGINVCGETPSRGGDVIYSYN
jgi:hypothetical protein